MTKNEAAGLLFKLRQSDLINTPYREAIAAGYMALQPEVANEYNRKNNLSAERRAVQCQNCERHFFESDGREIKHYNERVCPGEVAPVCECPVCGALAHYVVPTYLTVPEKRYVVAQTWEHLDVRNRPWIIRWVFDRWNDELVVAQEQPSEAIGWGTLTRSVDLKDIDQHLDANEGIFDCPEDYGLGFATTLPDWAHNAPLVKGYHLP